MQRVARAFQRSVEIDRRQARCPVGGVLSIGLRGFTARPDDGASIRGNELQPALPEISRKLTSAGADSEHSSIFGYNRFSELHEHLSHVGHLFAKCHLQDCHRIHD